MCLKCRQIKPLAQFGLRKMADGAIRNQPWCRPCRSGAGVPKPKETRGEHAAAPAADESAALEVESAELSPETPAPQGPATLEAAEASTGDRPQAPVEAAASPVDLPPA